MSEKTHQPTQKKLQDARKKGQIPRSKLFTSAAVTLGGLSATVAFAPSTAARVKAWTTSMLDASTTVAPEKAINEGVQLLAKCVAPSLAGALLGAIAVSVVQSGLQLNADAVSPRLERLDVVEGFKKLFSIRQLIDVVKGLAVAAVIVILFWNAVTELAPFAFNTLHYPTPSPQGALSHDGAAGFVALVTLLQPVVLKSAVVLLALGVADWAIARKRHIKDLMMSHEEVKQEHKNSEGDPHQKAKQKSLRKQIASGGAARGVQKATAVVVNPTHIAIALRYAEDECEAPYIVARGREEDALKIRREAQALGIPVVRDIPLARSLIHYDVGEEVPEELYQAAAAILKVALEESEARSTEDQKEGAP